jgi:hypothetical protein
MTQHKKTFLIASGSFLVFFALVAFKDFLVNGAFYIVSGDVLDGIDYYLIMPGSFLAFLLNIIVYQNIHDYNPYTVLLLGSIFSSFFYGWIVSIIIMKWNKRLKNGS